MGNLVETVVILLSTLAVGWAGWHAAYSVKSGPVELILTMVATVAFWPAPGITDREFRCHDETGGGIWDDGVFHESSS